MALTPLKISGMTNTSLPWAGTERIPLVKNPGSGDENQKGTILQFHTLVGVTFASLGSAVAAGAGAMRWVTDMNGGATVAVSNGSSWLYLSAPIYDLGLFIPGIPTGGGSSLLQKIMVSRDIIFPADFSGAYGHVSATPASAWAIDVQDDGVSIGTITVSDAGAFTFATGSGTAKTVAAGSRLEFYEPVSASSSIADISLTLPAIISGGLAASA